MNVKKKDVRKIKNATETEIKKLKEEYEIVTKNIHSIGNTVLILLCITGVATIFYFRDGFFDFVGFILFVYAFYTLSNRVGHQEGYLDGYYEASQRKDGTASGISTAPSKEGAQPMENYQKLLNK
jgi:hypothetical protein